MSFCVDNKSVAVKNIMHILAKTELMRVWYFGADETESISMTNQHCRGLISQY